MRNRVPRNHGLRHHGRKLREHLDKVAAGPQQKMVKLYNRDNTLRPSTARSNTSMI